MDFKELTRKISSKLNAITHKLNGRFTYFNEDDLYQEAMIHLWDKFNKGELQDKTDSFILQGCFFYLKNHIRKTYKRIDMNSTSLNQIIGDENNSLEAFISSQGRHGESSLFESALLEECIFRNLSAKEMRIISLVKDGLTTRGIGKKMGFSHVMVIKILNKIRQKCKKLRIEL
jgi:RNA polymerase sigma factor (sigma-70 family)